MDLCWKVMSLLLNMLSRLVITFLPRSKSLSISWLQSSSAVILEPLKTKSGCCSMSSSNYYFLTCIQVSQEASQLVWYYYIFKNFPQYIVIHTVKGFGIVNKPEIDVFLELSCCFNDPADLGSLISGSSAFSKTSLNIWKFTVHVLLKLGLGVVAAKAQELQTSYPTSKVRSSGCTLLEQLWRVSHV